MKRIASSIRNAFRNAFADSQNVINEVDERCSVADPRAQAPSAAGNVPSGDVREFTRAFSDGANPGIQYC